MSNWTAEWPTEPGTYLFYGHYKNSKPEFSICKVRTAGSGDRKFLMLVAGGVFLYPHEQTGVFKKFEEEPPDLVELLKQR